ncbi:hypothetical protein BGZ49_010148 [Haplosporangium sp. Z 27]|nr:hypothetical protein BGZ49_010148 [Haplosporangium sp. Z 27]
MSHTSNSKKPAKDQKPSNTLNSIVSNLVRAAIGGNHQDVPDNDLDKYVADMIMKSAIKTGKQYQSIGLQAYTSANSEDKARLSSGVIIDRSDSNGLKTNKRFLSSIIKNTDDHNQALIRAEEKKASEIAKELIADLDRRRARERSSRRDDRSSSSRMRMDNMPDSPSSPSRSVSPQRWSKRSRSRSISPSYSNEVRVRGRGSRKYDNNAASPPSSSGSKLGSKMDKYFQEGYDPLLDNHSDDNSPTIKKHKKKKEKKDRKSKEDKSRDRRDHKKHKSDKSDRPSSSSSRKSSHRHELDSEDSRETDDKYRRRDRHSSSSRRKRDDERISDDERRRSKSDRSKNRRDESPSSRSPSPTESRRHKSSHKSSRYRKEEERGRDKSASGRKRRRDHTFSGGSGSDTESSDGYSSGKRRHRSRTPPHHPQPQQSTREWDLHKINKGAIREQLSSINK